MTLKLTLAIVVSVGFFLAEVTAVAPTSMGDVDAALSGVPREIYSVISSK